MNKPPKIVKIECDNDYNLIVEFSNGDKRIMNFREKIKTPLYAKLSNYNLFKLAKVDIGGYGISWNDEIDISEYEIWKNKSC